MNMEDVDLRLVRLICGGIFLISVILYDSYSRYKILGDAKNVEIKNRTLMYYLIWILPWLCISSGLIKIRKIFATMLLQRKEKERFGNLLGGQNSFYIKDFSSKYELPTLFLLKFKGTPEEFVETMKVHMHNVLYHKLDHNQTICGTIESFQGFYYVKRDTAVNLHNYIKEFTAPKMPEDSENTKKTEEQSTNKEPDGSITKKELLNYIAENLQAPITTFDKQTLWKIYIGKQAVRWNHNDKSLYYSVIFKFSHCLFDRMSFMKLILGTFADIKNFHLLFPVLQEKERKKNDFSYLPLNLVYDCLHDIFQKLYCIYKSIPTILVNYTLLKRKDNNWLAKKERQNILYLYTIDLDENLLEKLSRIKKNFPHATEFSIIEAIILGGVTSFFRKDKGEIPVDVVSMSVENNKCLNLTKATPESLKYEEIAYESNVGFTFLNICTPRDEKTDVKKILAQICRQRKANGCIKEAEITRMLFNENYYQFSDKLKNLLCSDKFISTLISNYPGPSSKISMNSLSVEHIISWSPHLLDADVTFAFCSYRGTYQLTISVNTSLVNNWLKADGLVKNLSRGIDILLND